MVMEKDYWMALGKFCQAVWRLRRGKQFSTNTVYSGGEGLLASTGDIVGWWKEYFKNLLNPTDTPSVEEPEAEDSEVDLFITQAEVTGVVQQLLSGKAPGVDEIHPEYLKSLDVVGLSWLTRLCNIAWRSGTVPLAWVTGVVVPLFKKGDRRMCSNYRGIRLLSLPEKVYSSVLERRLRPLVEPRIQEEQCIFHPSRGTLDQLYTLHRVLKGRADKVEALRYCRNHHHDLVSVRTVELQLWVKEVARNASTEHMWLGLRHTCALGFWYWVNGEMICYQDWAPSNRTGFKECIHEERTGAVQSGGEQKWISLPQSEKLNYIHSTYESLFY
ncbi:hypothetical protein QTP86_009367 [Hemibagrus guttatus]|nr:hypothetical protein QTP86_009367 [Hemibagrus guttatus]